MDPVALDPALRQAGPRGRSAPAGRLPLRPRCRLLCPLQSRRLLLPHCRRRDAYGAVMLGRERAQRRGVKRRRGNGNALFGRLRSNALYEAASEWLTGRPRQSCQIPQQSRARYVAKKVARGSRWLRSIPSDYCGLPRPARFPKFESREIRGQQNNLSDGRSPPH